MANPKPSARERFLLVLAYGEKAAVLRADADRALSQKAISAEDYQTMREQYAPHERRAQRALERLRASAKNAAQRASERAAATRARQAALAASPGATAADATRINEEHRQLAAEAAKLEAGAASLERLARAERAATLGQPPDLPLDVFAAQIDEWSQPTAAEAGAPPAAGGGAVPSTSAAETPPVQPAEPVMGVRAGDLAMADDMAGGHPIRRFAPTLVLIAVVAGLALAGLFLLTWGSPSTARADLSFAPAADGGGAVTLTVHNRGGGPLQLYIPWPEERAALIEADNEMAHIGVDVYVRDEDGGEFRLLPPVSEAWSAAGASTDMVVEADLQTTITFNPTRLFEAGFGGNAVRLVVSDADGDELESYTVNLIARDQ